MYDKEFYFVQRKVINNFWSVLPTKELWTKSSLAGGIKVHQNYCSSNSPTVSDQEPENSSPVPPPSIFPSPSPSHLLYQGHFPLPRPLQAPPIRSQLSVDLNGAHQEVSTVATSIPRCWSKSLAFVIRLPLVFPFPCETLLQYLVVLVLIVIIFFRLINHKNRIKFLCAFITFSLARFCESRKHLRVLYFNNLTNTCV